MTRTDRLRRTARDAATWRGHTLGRFSATGYPRTGRAIAACLGCLAYVIADPNPPANGIDIGGSAVAVGHPVIR